MAIHIRRNRGPRPGYYVATWGNDANSGSFIAPWRTIQHAADAVSLGNAVWVRAGTYNEAVEIAVSGSASYPIRFMAMPGERPVIDGGDTLPGSYTGLVRVDGDYIIVDGFEIANSAYWATGVYGEHCTVRNVVAHDGYHAGILAFGDYSLIENCISYKNAQENYQGAMWEEGGWGTGISICRVDHDTPINYGTIRGCVSYDNWGEGISCFEANYPIIENNIGFNNWSTNIYLSDAAHVLCQQNFLYDDRGDAYMFGGEPDSWNYYYNGSNVGILVGNEGFSPALNDIKVINNICCAGNRNIYLGSNVLNVLIAYNTLVGSTYRAEIALNSSLSNVVVRNNIARRSGAIAVVDAEDEINPTYDHNNWSAAAPAYAQGTGDVTADPQLAESGSQYTVGWYMPGPSSPARAAGIPVSGVNIDFFGAVRGGTPTMGAIE
jgi:hypothetical protein